MYLTAIIDDDINSQNAAAQALSTHRDIKIVGAFNCGDDFFAFVKENAVDLVILDIELIGETGFDIAKKIQTEYRDISVIFLTGHASYAVDSFDFQPVFFLTKPINYDKLDKALDCLREKKGDAKQTITDAKLMFKCAREYRLVDVNKINYIERRSRKNYVVCDDEEFQIAYYTMNELMDMLENYGFTMCHKSYIVSLSKIERIYDEGRQLYWAVIKGSGAKVPVSRKQYDSLKKALFSFGLREL